MISENYRILIVDDEKDVVDMICRNLELEGYDVDGETDPKKSIEKIKERNYQIVISDIKMPDIDGVELLKEIKRIDGVIQVIMITGYVTPSNIVSCLSNGAYDCHFKPINIDKLKESIDQSIEKLERWKKVLGEISGLKNEEES